MTTSGVQPAEPVARPGVGPLLRDWRRRLAFISTVATFGTGLEITMSELSIESFFPADAATATHLSD